MNNYEWEQHRLEKQYEKNTTIDDTINEFNQLQINRKSKRINKLNNALDALQEILIQLTIKLTDTPQQNHNGQINPQYKEITDLITNTGQIYKALEQLHDTQTIAINTFKGYTNEWQDIKERLKPHHNPHTTQEDNIQTNIKTIDYFFDNYVNPN